MLDFFVSPAYAQGAQPQGDFVGIFMLVGMMVLFYFMLIRPQMKRSKEHRDMLGKLAKGDECITSGGLAGVVREIGENYVTIEVADGVSAKFQKSAVVSVLPKGSLKAL